MSQPIIDHQPINRSQNTPGNAFFTIPVPYPPFSITTMADHLAQPVIYDNNIIVLYLHFVFVATRTPIEETNMHFHHLLVPIAPEQEINDALHHAFRFADSQYAHVTLLVVIDDLAEFRDIHRYSGTALDVLDNATKIYHDIVKQQVAELKNHYKHIVFKTQIRVGMPFIEIIKEANIMHADMIVIDSHRQNKTLPCQKDIL